MPTNIHLDLIDRVRVASPCPMRWDDLEGDGAVRFCSKCRLNVHNLSMMTRAEAEAFVRERQTGEADETGRIAEAVRERTCVGFYRRADGTILTRDCPVGLRLARARALRAAGRVAAALGVLLAGAAVFGRPASSRLRQIQPFAALCARLVPARPAPPPPTWIAGDMIAPPPPASGATGGATCGQGGGSR